MTQQQIEAIRAEVWQAPDGTLTWIVSMVEQEAGLMVAFGTGFSCYYSDLAALQYKRITPPETT
jgi:hypothetical protein